MNTDLGPTQEQITTMREQVMTRIAPQPAASAQQHVRAPRSTRRRFGLVAIGAGAMVATLIVTGVLVPSGTGGGATAAAAEVLTRAAKVTITTSDPVVGPGQFLKINTSAVYATTGQGVLWLAPSTYVVYSPHNPDDEWVLERHTLKPTTFFGEGAEAAAMAEWALTEGEETTNGIFRENGGSRWTRVEETATMPRDAQKLYDYLYATYQGGSNSPDENAWVRITDLLRTGTVPADLRAALYGAAVLISGVEVVDDSATLNGRTGVALGRVEPSRDARQDIIVDPDTGELIGEREVLTADRGAVPAGTAIASTTVETSVVSAAP